MRSFHILLLASLLTAVSGSYAMADRGNGGWHGGGGGGHGAPLPVAGASLPILAAVGVYYLIRKRRG